MKQNLETLYQPLNNINEFVPSMAQSYNILKIHVIIWIFLFTIVGKSILFSKFNLPLIHDTDILVCNCVIKLI